MRLGNLVLASAYPQITDKLPKRIIVIVDTSSLVNDDLSICIG